MLIPTDPPVIIKSVAKTGIARAKHSKPEPPTKRRLFLLSCSQPSADTVKHAPFVLVTMTILIKLKKIN